MAALVLIEITLRFIRPGYLETFRLTPYVESERGKFSRFHAGLGWEGIPDAAGTFEWGDCHSVVQQNTQGYRGTDYPFIRTSSARVLFLGDSFVWGFGVNEDQLFSRLMELTGPRPLEIVNLGVSGYGPDQELLLWQQRGFRWKPDTVFLFFNARTDLDDVRFSSRYGARKPLFVLKNDQLTLTGVPVPFEEKKWSRAEPQRINPREIPVLQTLAAHSAAVAGLLSEGLRRNSTRRWLAAHHLLLPQYTDPPVEIVLYREPPSREFAAAWQLLARILERLNRDVKRSNARLVLVSVPTAAQVYPHLWNRLEGAQSLDRLAPSRHLKQIGDRLHVQVIDLLPALERAGQDNSQLYFPVNGHWTAEGHRVVAEALLQASNLSAAR